MKKISVVWLFLGVCAWCSAQTINIMNSIYGEYETVKEELVYDSDGMITQYKKVIIPTGEIDKLITVTKNENGLVVEEKSGDKTDVSYITVEENGVKIEAHYHGKDTISKSSFTKVGDELFRVVNGKLIYRCNNKEKKVFDGDSGAVILRREGNVLYDRDDVEITLVARKKDYMRIERQLLPPIRSASIYTIRGDVSALKKAFLLNYIILPFDLRYLLFFLD